MILVVNYSSPFEFEKVQELSNRFGDKLRIITDGKQPEIKGSLNWIFTDMDKRTTQWTKRVLAKFLDETKEYVLIKIDPDTVIKSLPEIPKESEVAGDFRISKVGRLFLGAFQYFTRNSVEKILTDVDYSGNCSFQDVSLGECISRLGLVCYNSPDVNGWHFEGDEECLIMHKGKFQPIPRLESGFVLNR